VDRRIDRNRATFEAYGTPAEGVRDPLLREIETLRSELSEMESRLSRLSSCRETAGE
jgi:hypothetical protein